MATTITGVDVFAGQGDVTWTSVRAAGRSFAIVKATEGRGFRDPRFTKARWQAMKQAGIVRGCYHFARPSGEPRDAQGEAHDFLAAIHDVGGVHSGDLPPALDLEVTKLNPRDTFEWVRHFVHEIREAVGRSPLLYTFPSFWIDQVGNPTDNLDCPLWIAHFGVPRPTVPRAWETYTFWQHSDHGHVNGISGPCDLDRLNGGRDTLKKLVLP